MQAKGLSVVVIVLVVGFAGCFGSGPQRSTTATAPEPISVSSHERVDFECLDGNGLGNQLIMPAGDDDRLTLNWSYDVPNRSVELQPTVHVRSDGEPPVYELAMQSSKNATGCEGRVKYETNLTLGHPEEPFQLYVTLDGRRIGTVNQTENSGGGGKAGGSGP